METENLFSSEHAAKTMSLIAGKAESGLPLTVDEQQFVEAFEKACPYIKVFNDKMDELQLTNEERYVLNFLLKANEPDRLNEMDMNTFMVLQLLSMDFVHQHKEQVFGLFDQEERNRLKTLLTKEYVSEVMGLSVPESEIAKQRERLEQSENTIDDILEIVGFGNAIHLLYGTPQMPVIAVKRADELVIATDKACNYPFINPRIYDYEIAKIKTSKSKDKPGPYLSVQIKELNENGLIISGIDRLNRFDREIHDAANSLHLAGNEYISPKMILKAIAADPDARPTKEMQEKVCNSMDKLRATYVTIDATNEAKAKGLDRLIYEGFILSATKVTAVLNGQETSCYKLAQPSIFYEYANQINRIGRFPMKVLPSKLEKNEEGIILQGEIRRRIYAAKGDKTHMSTVIKYEPLYEIVGLHPGLPKTVALRKKKKSIRDKVSQILDGFVKEKVIKSYTQNKKGKEFYSVTFQL